MRKKEEQKNRKLGQKKAEARAQEIAGGRGGEKNQIK